ncbi:MAG: hypothetical protein QGI46_14470 [Planctomycetota bacterium]|jgi:hypothetical protein|nr:hypothetical protein [Planctomycetota bacterium]
MNLDADTLERGLLLFEALIDEDGGHTRALEASWGAYSPGADLGTEDPGVHRRHLEWFLFEDGAAENLLGAWRERADAELRHHGDAFLASEVGLFVVTAVQPEGGAALEEIAGLGSFILEPPGPGGEPAVGDLIVGRLYPVGEGRHCSSPAAAVFRSEKLLAAIRADIGRLREERDQAVLRVSQAELEAMFWGPQATSQESAGSTGRERAADEALQCLSAGGVDEAEAAELVDSFRSLPYDPRTLTPGAGDPLAAALEQLAFESEVDLERARALLLALWAQPVREESAPAQAPAPAPHGDPARALAAFDRARRSGADVATSIATLERHLGLDDVEDLEEAGEDAPDFPGVVAAMVEEFLWDVAREDGETRAAELEPLLLLGEFAGHVGVFENLAASDLLTFCAFWVFERGGLVDPERARSLLAGLERFCSWAEAQHDLPLAADFGGDLEGLSEHLPRAAAANGALQAPGAEGAGEVYRLLELKGEHVRIESAVGSTREVRLPAGLAGHLRAGDTLRAEVDDSGVLMVLRCYPPQARSLLCAGNTSGPSN